jgi:hypothetical protein
MIDADALPILVQQTVDSDWFRALALVGTTAFAPSGVALAQGPLPFYPDVNKTATSLAKQIGAALIALAHTGAPVV